uniref:ABC transmembrane type-1 domain-containing protein n=1 Tax=Branchiostoma floridae TaxID=7739 RepID=C3Z6U3_BRAFL|eukprot:XP_002595527.1 hypothetical protein BRAFLDRAFT_118956 [Branchiostoma floridae]
MADSLFCGPAYPSVNGNTTTVDVRTEECLVDGLNLIPHAGYLPWALLGHYARWIVALVLLFTTLCEVGEGALSDSYTPGHHIHLYLPWIVALLATLLACVYYYQVETSNKPRLLLPLCVYYVMSAGFKAARLAHLYNRDVSSTRLRLSLTWTSVVLYAMCVMIEGYTLFKVKYLSASPVQLKPHSDLKDDNMYYVFPYVTLPSRLTFWWASFILRVGYKEPLEMSHLGKMPKGPYLVTAGEFFGNGYILLILMLIVNILRYQLDYFGAYMTFQEGVQLKAAIQTMIYNKVLKLSSCLLSSDKVTAGQVMNHAGMDAQQLLVMMSLIHNPWSMVLQATSDTRMKRINETIQSFGTYEFFNENSLTAASAFASLSLFNIMAFPLIFFPVLLRTFINAAVATKRLEPFFESDEVEGLGNMCRHDVHCDEDDERAEETADVDVVLEQKVGLLRSSYDKLPEDENSIELKQLAGELSQITNMAEDVAIEIRNGNFSWELATGTLALHDINLKVLKEKLTVVVGQVGSGKSSLCSAILGEMRTLSGQVLWHKYQKVISACCLQPDIDILPGGDMTEIGEKGINLSGGQKQRVSLARALYSNSDIVILDDPLSALDAHVGGDVFEHGIMAHLINDEKRTVVLVTHKLQYLEESQYQYVVAMENGRILAQGTMDDIRQSNPDLCDSWREIIAKGIRETQERTRTRTSTSGSSLGASSITDEDGKNTEVGEEPEQDEEEEEEEEVDEGKAAEGKLVKAEERSVGSVRLQHYLIYAAACGPIAVVLLLLLQLSKHGLQIGIDFWLSAWASAGTMAGSPSEPQNSTVNQTMGNASKAPPAVDVSYYIIGYTGLSVAAIVLTAFASALTILTMIRGAKKLHEAMVRNVVLAPMRFFDTTPTGRVLNRMSEDTATIDLRLPLIMEHLIRVVLLICSALLVNAVVTPYFLIGAVPIVVFYYMVQKYYRATAREIKRLDNINKSPVFAHFSETLGGLTTVRAYRMEKKFSTSLMDKLDRSNTPVYYTNAISSWIGARLGYLGAIIVFLAGLSSMLAAMFGSVSSAMVGLSITYALNIQMYLLWLVRGYAMIEMMMTSVERVDSYSSIPTEPYNTDGNVIPDDNWPSKGEVTFEDVSVRYDKTLDPVLTDVSATFEAGEKLFCMARAFVRKCRILIMDEATASIDMETHRIATILDSDRILVLDQGKVVENDTPDKLLKQPSGLFASLVKANK